MVVSRSRDEIPLAFSLHFCILQAIKNWRYRRPRNKAAFLEVAEVKGHVHSFNAMS